MTESQNPRSVEMPRPTAWPLVIALAVALVMFGAATEWAFSIVGGVLFVISLIGWIANLLPGRGHEHELILSRDREAAELLIQPRPGTVQQLKPGVVGYRFQLPEKVHPVSAGVRGGIVGGLLMPIPALLWAVFSGHSIWFPVNLLAGLVIPGLSDLPAKELEAFHPWLFAGALALHVAFSVGFGLIGGVILPTLPSIPGGPLLFGGLILPLLWSGANHSMMGIVNPVLNHYIDWRWYVVSQLVYGIATSIVILRSEEIPIAPRGRGNGGTPRTPPSAAGGLLLLCLLLSGCNRDWEDLPGKPVKADEFVMPHDVKSFADLYAQRCSACHGPDGRLGVGPPLNDALYAALATLDELKSVIADGRHDSLMPAWSQSAGGPLTSQQVNILADGIKQRKWKSPVEAADESIVAKAQKLRLNSVVGSAQAGEKVFESACATCHGKDGDSGPIDDPAFLTLMSDEVLRRYIITGRLDLDMPNFADSTGRGKDFTPLTAKQVDDLIALFGSWRKIAAQ